MSKATFTPTPWAEYDSDTYKTLKADDYQRARACVNAFPDDWPTEKITPGFVGRMRDALAHLLEFADRTGQGCAKQVEDARALLAEIEE